MKHVYTSYDLQEPFQEGGKVEGEDGEGGTRGGTRNTNRLYLEVFLRIEDMNDLQEPCL